MHKIGWMNPVLLSRLIVSRSSYSRSTTSSTCRRSDLFPCFRVQAFRLRSIAARAQVQRRKWNMLISRFPISNYLLFNLNPRPHSACSPRDDSRDHSPLCSPSPHLLSPSSPSSHLPFTRSSVTALRKEPHGKRRCAEGIVFSKYKAKERRKGSE